MQAVTIHDKRVTGDFSRLAFDLIDLLRLFECEVHLLSWTCERVWSLGDGADEFDRVSDGDASIDGSELLRLASGVYQVIDGEFAGTPPAEQRPRLVIVADDSSCYVVASPEPELLNRVRERFSDVRESQEWAEEFIGQVP